MKSGFMKRAARFYRENISALVRSLFPQTSYHTHFMERYGFQEFLTISTTWMGQTLKSEVFELKHRPEREEFLRELHKQGHISNEEFEKYLHN